MTDYGGYLALKVEFAALHDAVRTRLGTSLRPQRIAAGSEPVGAITVGLSVDWPDREGRRLATEGAAE